MILDGHALVHRSFRAISVRQNLTVSKTGEDVTGVYGFSNTFLRAIQEWSPTHCAIAFDLPVPTFRHLQYPDYKAHRPETPPELRPQFDRARELMRAFNVPVFEVEGYEADDVIGTLCRKAEEQQMEAVILTGDTDTFQLVSPWVRVDLHYSAQERKVYDEIAVRERYGGLVPAQQPDLKALKGDPSDNIPGVPGIGDKTAVKLLVEYDSLEGIYEHIDDVKPNRARESLRSNRETAFLGRELTTIVRDAPIELDMEQCRFWNYNRRDVVDLFRELEFARGIVSRVPDPAGTPQPQAEPAIPRVVETPSSEEYRVVDTREKLDSLVEALANAGSFAFDTETTSTDAMMADLVGLSFATAPGQAWYVPVAHDEGIQLPMEEVLARLRPLLESPQLGKTAHNGNYDLTVMSRYGVAAANMDFDTMIAAHLLGKERPWA